MMFNNFFFGGDISMDEIFIFICDLKCRKVLGKDFI